MNVVLWDIESSGLNADWGTIYSIAWKRLGEKRVHCRNVTQYDGLLFDDRPLLRDVYPELAAADMWVTHNGVRFDVPFVNAKLLEYRMPTLPPIPHVDTYNSIARKHLRVSSRRMGNLCEYFGLTDQKESLTRKEWREAQRGSAAAIKRIARYGMQDVRALEGLYLLTRPLLKSHPNLSLLDGVQEGMLECPKCGVGQMKNRGYYLKRVNMWQRLQCLQCKSWAEAPIHKDGTWGRPR